MPVTVFAQETHLPARSSDARREVRIVREVGIAEIQPDYAERVKT